MSQDSNAANRLILIFGFYHTSLRLIGYGFFILRKGDRHSGVIIYKYFVPCSS